MTLVSLKRMIFALALTVSTLAFVLILTTSTSAGGDLQEYRFPDSGDSELVADHSIESGDSSNDPYQPPQGELEEAGDGTPAWVWFEMVLVAVCFGLCVGILGKYRYQEESEEKSPGEPTFLPQEKALKIATPIVVFCTLVSLLLVLHSEAKRDHLFPVLVAIFLSTLTLLLFYLLVREKILKTGKTRGTLNHLPKHILLLFLLLLLLSGTIVGHVAIPKAIRFSVWPPDNGNFTITVRVNDDLVFEREYHRDEPEQPTPDVDTEQTTIMGYRVDMVVEIYSHDHDSTAIKKGTFYVDDGFDRFEIKPGRDDIVIQQEENDVGYM